MKFSGGNKKKHWILNKLNRFCEKMVKSDLIIFWIINQFCRKLYTAPIILSFSRNIIKTQTQIIMTICNRYNSLT